jgi:endoglucanase
MPLSLIKSFAEAHGTSGAESAVRRLIQTHLAPLGKLETDGMGSVVFHRKGAPSENAPRVMITAHMDEVGFAVQNITERGFLKIVALGGWWTHNLLSQRLRILTKSGREVLGIVASVPPHFLSESQREKVLSLENLFVDVGAKNRADAQERLGISLGDPIVPESPFTTLNQDTWLVCKAFDNRVGCSALTQAFVDLENQALPCQALGVATVQEEVGCRGAVPATTLSRPDIAFVLECTPADDTPGFDLSEAQGKLSHGVQIRLLDPSALMNRKMVDFATEVARQEGIAHQLAVRRGGGTDAKSIQLGNLGVPCVVLGVPSRYIHSHNSLIDLADYQALVALVKALLKRCDAAAVANLRSFD